MTAGSGSLSTDPTGASAATGSLSAWASKTGSLSAWTSVAAWVSVSAGASAVGASTSSWVAGSASGSTGSAVGTTRGAASVTVAAIADRSGGSGMAWAIVAMRVGSCSASSRSKNSVISASNSVTVLLTRSTRASMIAAKASISPSRADLRATMRASVSSRMRAISVLDHSRTAATSSSARRRRPAASSAEPVRISSTATFASDAKRVMVSSREDSAAVCMARLRSAMNLVGRRAAVMAVASVMSVVMCSSAAVGSSTATDASAGCAVRLGRRLPGHLHAGLLGRRVTGRVARLSGVIPLGRPGKLEARSRVGLGHRSSILVGGDVRWGRTDVHG